MSRVLSLLERSGTITSEQYTQAVELAAREGDSAAERALVEQGVDEVAIAQTTAQAFGLEFMALDDAEVDPATLSAVPQEIFRRHVVFPVQLTARRITLAVSDPRNLNAVDDVSTATGLAVQTVVSPRSQLVEMIDRYFRSDEELTAIHNELEEGSAGVRRASSSESLEDGDDEGSPVVRFVNLVLMQAIRDRASDIHIEPMERSIRVRYRIDGVLHTMNDAPIASAPGVVSRLKVMAGLDISEKRRSLDGRFSVTLGDRSVDMRIATLPTVWGEKVVLRILEGHSSTLSVNRLGMSKSNLQQFQTAYRRPHGLVLVTGPTGSGKSTTLYTAISDINTDSVNIITVEDPVEMRIPGITQVQVNPKAGLTFATALRSILRSDPDVVLIGEIRDQETAQIAVEAALTGHLVFSTLHTNDAASSVSRLTEMGVEPYLLSASLRAMVAQRLVRRLCASCRVAGHADPELLEASMLRGFISASDAIFHPSAEGCRDCSNTGYRGRIAVHEVLTVDDSLSGLIARAASPSELQNQAVAGGMSTLAKDGALKVKHGVTSLEEILRISS